MAELIACSWSLRRYPDAFSFVKSQEKKPMKNLKITYIRGQAPAIRLLNAEGELEEEHLIGSWDSQTILDFLHERLE